MVLKMKDRADALVSSGSGHARERGRTHHSAEGAPRLASSRPHPPPFSGPLVGSSGVALPTAIFALLVVGVLVGTAFFVGRQEQLVGRNTVRAQQAFAAAEAGLHVQLGAWVASEATSLGTGDSMLFSGSVSASGWYRGSLRRLNDLLFLIRSEGFSADSAARQQVGMVVRLQPVGVSVAAALRTLTVLGMSGSSQVDGTDNVPSTWGGCPIPDAGVPGIQLPDAGQLAAAGCTSAACVAGNPPVDERPLTADSLLVLADGVVGDLRAQATKVIPSGGYRTIQPSSTGGICNTDDPDNWGSPAQPLGPCGRHFPLVWVDGDLAVNGVQGQGVLVVAGDLVVDGGFEFYGPVIVTGTLTTRGAGGHFFGGVVAGRVDLAQDEVTGTATIAFSSCALARAVRSLAAASPLRSRAWLVLY